ncbi:nucleotide sugar dehydrogenase [Candidatus Pelagibacter bacterium]|nr:nucleotide sugar dehydrogenase [Candidatus Pelagibacter bacterium]
MDSKIAIIGLGYVGLPLAVEFSKKYNVIGFDINQNRIDELEINNDSTLEVEDSAITSVRDNLNFTSSIDDTKECNIYIVCIPTPIDEFNSPNLQPLISSSKSVGKVIKKNDIVIYESTVYPGVTEDVCVKELEKSSGLKFNQDFFCGYSPERVNPGDKVNTLTKIKKITSGSTPEIADKIDELYKSIITAGTYKASSIQVAEAAKVIENTQRDLNIAFTNELSVILGRLNLDTIEVLEAAGSKWNFLPFRPGLVGGHCIGVDPYYLTHAAEQVNYNPQVILAGRRINDNMGFYIVKKVIQQMINNGIEIKNSTVGLMGITFKENCPDFRNSKIIDVYSELKNWGASVVVIDPWVDQVKLQKEHQIKLGKIDKDNKVDSLIVAVGHNQFRALSAKELKSFCNGSKPVIGDVKSIYNKQELIKEGFSVFRL